MGLVEFPGSATRIRGIDDPDQRVLVMLGARGSVGRAGGLAPYEDSELST